MKKAQVIKSIHWLGYIILLTSIIFGFIRRAEGQDAFMEYLKEDGLIENLTTLFLLFTSITSVVYIVRNYRTATWAELLTRAGIAFLFFFAAGEEISWGQRLFEVNSSDFFMQNNAQGETNLHNLVVGDVKINKLIFSQLLTVGLVIYLLLLRPLGLKVPAVRKFISFWDIPLPRWNHVIGFVIGTILVSQYNMLKAGEMREFVFAVVFFLIILWPATLSMGWNEKRTK